MGPNGDKDINPSISSSSSLVSDMVKLPLDTGDKWDINPS